VANLSNSTFVERLKRLPHFDYQDEVDALAKQHGHTTALLQEVIERKFASKDDACRLWADALNVAHVDPFASVITDEAIAKLPVEIAKKARAIGLYVFNGVLTTAMAAPDDADLVKRLSQIAQMPISPVFALPHDIDDAIVISYSSDKGLEESLNELERSRLFTDPNLAAEKIAQLAGTDSLIQIVDEIIHFALRERATDIHIEPQENVCRIRFRVDGMLREVLTYSRKLHRAIISRLKIQCSLNISESRFPQDGRFSMPIGSLTANFRFSCIPSA